MEVQRSDFRGQYLGSATEKTKQKIVEAHGDVLFIDEAYRLIPTAGGKYFGREAIKEVDGRYGGWQPSNDLRRVQRQNGKVTQRKSKTEV